MQHTFGLIVPGAVITSLLNSSVTIRLCGSLPELGSWSIDHAPRLTLLTKAFYRPVQLLNEPRFYRVDINLPVDTKEFTYKYVINDDLWEGIQDESRRWLRNDCKNLVDQVYYTPIDYWIDVKASGADEPAHTGNFYHEIIAHEAMHYGRVNDKLYVGSCPRLLSHIENDLARELGITVVINLQVVKDIERNCRGIIGGDDKLAANNEFDLTSVDKLRKAYEKAGILFLWMPITDFSTTGRELMSPQATLVLKTVLEKGHQVYVHCNAGVGRAFGLICAYHHFVLKIPLPIVHYELAPIRSCGYFDRIFLENAKLVYEKAFE